MREFPSAIRRDTETTVQLDDTRLLLAFKEPRRFEDLSLSLRDVGLVFEHDREDVDGTLTPDRVNHTDTRFWVSSADGRPIDEDRYRLVLDAFGPELDWVGPVYRMPDSYGREGLHCPLPRVLIVRGAQMAALQGRTRVREDAQRSRRMIDLTVVTIEDPEVDAYQVRVELTDDGRRATDGVLFETMPLLVPLTFFRPNDPLLFRQWNVNRVRAVGPPDLEAGGICRAGMPGSPSACSTAVATSHTRT